MKIKFIAASILFVCVNAFSVDLIASTNHFTVLNCVVPQGDGTSLPSPFIANDRNEWARFENGFVKSVDGLASGKAAGFADIPGNFSRNKNGSIRFAFRVDQMEGHFDFDPVKQNQNLVFYQQADGPDYNFHMICSPTVSSIRFSHR